MAISSSYSRDVAARQDLIPGSRYTSGRAAALGDAFLPVGDDVASALFYNPAGLGKLRKAELEPLNISMYGNQGYAGLIDSNFYKVYQLSSYVPTLQRQRGVWSGVGGAVLPTFGTPGFGFGILLQSQLSGVANADGTVTYRSLYQFVPALSTGFRLLNGMIRVGYSLQWVNQASGSATVDAGGASDYNQGLAQGSCFSHNLGVALTIPSHSLPSFNVVVRNALGSNFIPFTLFTLTPSPTTVPAVDPMTVDASFSITSKLGRGVALNLILVDRDMTNVSGDAFIAHFALGGEMSLGGKLFLRGGWQGGYLSGGLGLKRSGAELSLTYYTEEMGTQYMSQGDSRYMFQYQVRAF